MRGNEMREHAKRLLLGGEEQAKKAAGQCSNRGDESSMREWLLGRRAVVRSGWQGEREGAKESSGAEEG